MKYKTYRPKKLLPKIIKSIKPSQKLRDSIYEVEEFDCIKRSIAGRRDNKTDFVPKPIRQEKIRTVKEHLLEIYTEADLIRFREKKIKRLERPKLSAIEWTTLCNLVIENWQGRKGKKKSIEWEKRKAKLLKRRKKDKKRRKFSQYETYINSEEWAQRRNKFWQGHTKRCAVCDTTRYIHLHHMHYGNFGNEPDEHLVPLCKEHHAQYHKENGVQRDMIRKTTAFIENNRSL